MYIAWYRGTTETSGTRVYACQSLPHLQAWAHTELPPYVQFAQVDGASIQPLRAKMMPAFTLNRMTAAYYADTILAALSALDPGKRYLPEGQPSYEEELNNLIEQMIGNLNAAWIMTEDDNTEISQLTDGALYQRIISWLNDD